MSKNVTQAFHCKLGAPHFVDRLTKIARKIWRSGLCFVSLRRNIAK